MVTGYREVDPPGQAEVPTTHRLGGDDCSVLLVVDEDTLALKTLFDRLPIYARSTRSGFSTIACCGAEPCPPEANA